MSDEERKDEKEDLEEVLKEFFKRHDRHLASLLHEDEHLKAMLPHMHLMSQEEKEDILIGRTATKRGDKMLDFVRQNGRGTFDIQRQFLQQVCKLDPSFQRIIRSELKDSVEIFVGKFQYSRTSDVTMFPPDSQAYKLVTEEFNASAGNPFLPKFNDFIAKCPPNADFSPGKELTLDDIRRVLEKWQPKKGRSATVEDIVHLTERLGLWALREQLVEEKCFGVYIKKAEPDAKSEEDNFSFKHWEPDPTRALFKISRQLCDKGQCQGLAIELGLSAEVRARLDAVRPYAFESTHAYDMLKAWYQANAKEATAKKLHDALLAVGRSDIIQQFKA